MVQQMTLDQIRQRGLAALRRELGPVGTIRFLQKFEMGSGNYARDRHAWVNAYSLDDLRSLAERKPSTKTQSKQRKTP